MDFTCMTDAQIADYFKNATGKTCGRFNNTQLNRNIPLNYKQRLFSPFKYVAAWLMALEVTSFKAKASDTFDTTNYILPADTLVATAPESDTLNCVDTTEMSWFNDNDTLSVKPVITIGDTYVISVTETYGYTTAIMGNCTPDWYRLQKEPDLGSFNWFNRFFINFRSNRLLDDAYKQNIPDTPDRKGGGVLAHIRAAVLVRRLKTLLFGNKRV